mgnify:CR=1 FL=1
MEIQCGYTAEFCAVLPHKWSWLYGFAVRLEYSVPKFYGIQAKDRFVEFCKFHG